MASLRPSTKYAARSAMLKLLSLTAPASVRVAAPLNPPRKVLVIRPDHLGDVLMATPALAMLRRNLPQAEITALVGPWGGPSLQNNPDVDKVIKADFPGMSRQPPAHALAPYTYARSLAQELQAQKYEAVINLRYDYWWGAILGHLAGIPARFGYDWPEAHNFLNFRFPHESAATPLNVLPFGQSDQHATAMNLALTRFFLQTYNLPTELSSDDANLKFVLSEDDKRYVASILEDWQLKPGQPLIAIHPGAGASIKLWSAENFATIADALAEKYNAKVVLVGGDSEKMLIQQIVKTAQSPLLVWEAVNSLGRLAALFSRCQLVLGLDSLAVHLGIAVGTPTLHLFGPTDPAQFGPWGDPARHIVVRTAIDLPCLPCGVLDFKRTGERGGYCMRTIKVSQVAQAADQILQG